MSVWLVSLKTVYSLPKTSADSESISWNFILAKNKFYFKDRKVKQTLKFLDDLNLDISIKALNDLMKKKTQKDDEELRSTIAEILSFKNILNKDFEVNSDLGNFFQLDDMTNQSKKIVLLLLASYSKTVKEAGISLSVSKISALITVTNILYLKI